MPVAVVAGQTPAVAVGVGLIATAAEALAGLIAAEVEALPGLIADSFFPVLRLLVRGHVGNK
jgi:hypothetical protein